MHEASSAKCRRVEQRGREQRTVRGAKAGHVARSETGLASDSGNISVGQGPRGGWTAIPANGCCVCPRGTAIHRSQSAGWAACAKCSVARRWRLGARASLLQRLVSCIESEAGHCQRGHAAQFTVTVTVTVTTRVWWLRRDAVFDSVGWRIVDAAARALHAHASAGAVG